MAAAVRLCERGIPVTVFESGAIPGGRARRVSAQGIELDNGQHILVGAYTALCRLMRMVGVPAEALLRLPLEIRYAHDFHLRSLRLPAPLGVLAGLLLARGVPLRERLGALAFVRAVRKSGFRLQPDIPVLELLRRHGQQGRIGHYLWRPLCVSALNTPVDQASANAFLAALRDSLAGSAGASDLMLPRRDLSRLFPEPAAQFVSARGGEVRLRHAIDDLSGLERDFSSVVVAVGPHQLKALLPESPLEYAYQPIYTCYLQYAETTRLPYPMLGIAGGLVQWVFDRGTLLGEHGRLACVISAEGDHQRMTQDELAEACALELARAFPHLAAPRWMRVIAEKRATIKCVPGVIRPSTLTGRPGVYLAGDYTEPEYPPTLEAAVRSGLRAAAAILQE